MDNINPTNTIVYAQDKVLIISNFLDEIYEIFTSNYYFSEFLINLFFILLVLIISIIIYWDSVNTKVSKNSRCKKQLDIYDKSKGVYIVEAQDKNRNKLFNIEYILGAKRSSLECACKTGDVVNDFYDIPIRDLKNNTDKNITKKCLCDRHYDIGADGTNISYVGDAGLVRYMDTKDTKFFDSYYDLQYT